MAQSISDDTPNGRCRKCGFHLQSTKGNQKICVNCDIQGDQPTDHTNQYGDPGHEAMSKVMVGALPKTVPTIPPKPRQEVEKVVVSEGGKTENMLQPKQALEILQNYFASLPVTDLKQAKELLKLRKDIEILNNKITKFLGGN